MAITQTQRGCGGGLRKYHSGVALQRGTGLFSAIARIFSRVLPTAKKLGRAALVTAKKAANSSTANQLKDIALTTALDSASDLLVGGDPGKRLNDGLDSARKTVASALREESNKRRRPSFKNAKKPKTNKKRKDDEIYDLLGK